VHPNPNHTVMFGVEMEFESDIDPLIGVLLNDEMLPSRGKHDYHCGCEHCQFETGYDIKAQRDSSCGGEIITRPYTFGEWQAFKELTDHIQMRAAQVGIEPGPEAGVHVHVTPPSGVTAKGKAFSAFYLWQRELEQLAAGRERNIREFNTPVGPMPDDGEFRYGGATFSLWMNQQSVTVDSLPEHLKINNDIRKSFYSFHHEYADRHSYLNTRTGHNTWEYRLWNSSRAAWRLRGYVAWSVALADPNVADEMLSTSPDLRTLGSIFLNHGHTLAGGSVNRQARWVTSLGGSR
jgi:hypothetical protein